MVRAVPRSPSWELLLYHNPTCPLLPKPLIPARPREGGLTGSPSLPGAPSFPGGPGGPGGPCGPGIGRASGLCTAGPWGQRGEGTGWGAHGRTLPSPRGHAQDTQRVLAPTGLGAAGAPRVRAQEEPRGRGAAPGAVPRSPVSGLEALTALGSGEGPHLFQAAARAPNTPYGERIQAGEGPSWGRQRRPSYPGAWPRLHPGLTAPTPRCLQSQDSASLEPSHVPRHVHARTHTCTRTHVHAHT